MSRVFVPRQCRRGVAKVQDGKVLFLGVIFRFTFFATAAAAVILSFQSFHCVLCIISFTCVRDRVEVRQENDATKQKILLIKSVNSCADEGRQALDCPVESINL